jgi:hypothetical protein
MSRGLGVFLVCYGLYSLGERFETYEPFVSLVFDIFRAAVNRG